MTTLSKTSKILIIDDEAAILHALQIFLEQEGYGVETATKYEDYLEKTPSKDLPHLIILDILLLNEDGREIAKHIKSTKKTKHIPIIMISAHYAEHDIVEQTGADAFIVKPFDIDDLLGNIDRLLKNTPDLGGLTKLATA